MDAAAQAPHGGWRRHCETVCSTGEAEARVGEVNKGCSTAVFCFMMRMSSTRRPKYKSKDVDYLPDDWFVRVGVLA